MLTAKAFGNLCNSLRSESPFGVCVLPVNTHITLFVCSFSPSHATLPSAPPTSLAVVRSRSSEGSSVLPLEAGQ